VGVHGKTHTGGARRYRQRRRSAGFQRCGTLVLPSRAGRGQPIGARSNEIQVRKNEARCWEGARVTGRQRPGCTVSRGAAAGGGACCQAKRKEGNGSGKYHNSHTYINPTQFAKRGNLPPTRYRGQLGSRLAPLPGSLAEEDGVPCALPPPGDVACLFCTV
jgi:hypothetical protein